MLFFNRSFLFGIVVLFALAACGGGDGDGDTTVNRAWGTPELIETDDVGDALDPQIAFDASGNALAVWEQDDRTRFKSGPTSMNDFLLGGSNRPEYGLFTKQHLPRAQLWLTD